MRVRLGYVSISKALDGISASNTLTYTHYMKLDSELAMKLIDKKIVSNFENLEKIIKYNIKNNIHFYRMTSNLIPLATHQKVNFEYIRKYNKFYNKIGKLINDNNLRVDTHPDQYCVLNSTKSDIVNSSISILKFHKNMLKVFKIKNPKMILHVGSSVFGKKNSMKRFINNFNTLDDEIKKMLIIENDDKIFNIIDVLDLCTKINVPMVLDYHHFMCNNNGECLKNYVEKIFNTWNNDELVPKVHFSYTKNKTKKEFRSHHDYVDSDEFIKFIEDVKFLNRDFDIMIEAKMKDDALFRLVRELKYKTNYKFIDDTTFEV